MERDPIDAVVTVDFEITRDDHPGTDESIEVYFSGDTAQISTPDLFKMAFYACGEKAGFSLKDLMALSRKKL